MEKLTNALSSLRDYTQTDYTLDFSRNGRLVWLVNADIRERVSPGMSKARLATWIAKRERAGDL